MPKTATPELIAALRNCAEDGLTQDAAVVELTSPAHVLTRGAVAGIASRNGIKFVNERGKDTKPRERRTGAAALHISRVPLTGSFIRPTMRKAAGPRCSWSGCTCDAVPGDMFCDGHARKALL